MPLTSEQVYNDLTGSEVRAILQIRLSDLLNQVPSLQSHLTLPRVKMTLSIRLDIDRQEPSTIEINDSLVLRVDGYDPSAPGDPGAPNSPSVDSTHESLELEAVIDSNTLDGISGTGQPPDQIRAEHGLPISEPQRNPMGVMEDVPVVHDESIKYAAFVNQDYGPARNRTGYEAPIVGASAIGNKNTGAAPEIGVDFRKVRNPDQYKESPKDYE